MQTSVIIMLICRFPSVLPYTAPEECDLLCEEFTSYQLLGEKDITNDVWDTALVHEDDDKYDDDRSTRYYRMDMIWNYDLSNMRLPDGYLCFPKLSQIARLILVIPHSNAEEERLFSLVRKNKTAFRPNLDPKGTPSSLLTIMLANDKPAHKFKPTRELLKEAKSATSKYNKGNAEFTDLYKFVNSISMI